jgi:hypothetical protein
MKTIQQMRLVEEDAGYLSPEEAALVADRETADLIDDILYLCNEPQRFAEGEGRDLPSRKDAVAALYQIRALCKGK